MKRILAVLAAVLTPLPICAVATAEGTQLQCQIRLLQSVKASQEDPLGSSSVQLEPRTAFGRQLSAFSLDLSKLGGEAWLHQNLCVNRRDFRGGRFAGTLCVLVMTQPEAEESTTTSSLVVDVSRLGRRTPSSGGAPSLGPENLGGFSMTVPVDASGKSITLTQWVPVSRDREELLRIEMACGT